MFLWDWMQWLLQLFGFNRNAKILIVGLDNAGKSTFVYMLTERAVQSTGQARCEEMTFSGLDIQTYHLGGRRTTRRVWLDHFTAVDVIVFMIDSAYPERFEEGRTELTRILDDPDIPPIPILILGNKTDRATAIGKEELIMTFDLQRHLHEEARFHETENAPSPRRECQLMMGSLLKRPRFEDAFRWLAKATKK